jgi:hypothetical protein
MASLTNRNLFQLQWDSYRLTSDPDGYEVLSAILALSVARGRSDTGCIRLQCLVTAAQELRERDARLYVRPIPPAISEREVLSELQDLDARGVIAFDVPSENHIIAEPLIRTWHGIASVRLDTNGEPVRRIV